MDVSASALAILPVCASFVTSYAITKLWIRVASSRGLVGKDMNKRGKILVAEAGGFSVAIGISIGLLFYILLKGLFGTAADFRMVEAFAVVSITLLASFLGFVDDVLGWKRGLPQWVKPLLSVPIAMPFVSLALLYSLGNGLSRYIPVPPSLAHYVYSFILVPVGVIGATNAINMLAGFNGLEAGMSLIILLFFALHALVHGSLWITLFCAVGVAALLAFLLFNWYPARVFPGDTLTYAMGAYIAAMAILGSMELFGVVLFIPYFIELVLKLRSRLELGTWAENFGVPRDDGTLAPRYKKVYSLTHVLQRIPGMTEKKLVLTLLLIETALGFVAFYLF